MQAKASYVKLFPTKEEQDPQGFHQLGWHLVPRGGHLHVCPIDSCLVRGEERARGRRGAKFLKGEASLGVSYPRKCALSYMRRWNHIQRVFPSHRGLIFAVLPLHKQIYNRRLHICRLLHGRHSNLDA